MIITLSKGQDTSGVQLGKVIEVQGISKEDSQPSINGLTFNVYDSDFDMQSYE